MPLTVDTVLAEIEALHRAKPLFQNPAWADFIAGKFTKDQVRALFRQNGIIPLHNHNYHGRLYVVCPDPAWRAKIAEVCYEEGTGKLHADGVPHYELYLRLGEALGVARAAMWNTPYCAGALAFREFFIHICGRSFLEGVSAHMLAGEAPVPAGSVSRAEALRQQFELSEEDLAFFTVHIKADTDHANIGRDLLSAFATTEDELRLVLRTVEDTIDIMWLMYDDIHRHLQTMG